MIKTETIIGGDCGKGKSGCSRRGGGGAGQAG